MTDYPPPTTRSSILVIDDTPANIEVLYAMLAQDYEILFATSGPQGLELAATANPDLILLDIRMPAMDGLEVCRRLKDDASTRHIPVIFLTAMSDDGHEIDGLRAGAIDYIGKPYNQAVVRQRLTNHLTLKRYRDLLENLAWVDGLTGIPNRRRFDQMLENEWQRAMRGQTPLSLLLMDLDGFKTFNDRHGHLAGDDCLKTVARALAHITHRASDLVCRYGGEEFACLLPGTDAAGARHVAETMRLQVGQLAIPLAPHEGYGHVTLSLGMATLIPERDADARALLAMADAALYRAKAGGRNQCR